MLAIAVPGLSEEHRPCPGLAGDLTAAGKERVNVPMCRPKLRLDVTERLASQLLGIPMASDLALSSVTLVVESLLEGVSAGVEREMEWR